jgi:hypothetical protein
MTSVVHIGIHKTGTTSIQKFAAQHRLEFRKRGLWYPDFQDVGLPPHYAHHHLAISLGGNGRFSQDEIKMFVDHVQANKRVDETVLYSAEPFYRMLSPEVEGTPEAAPTDDNYWAQRDAYTAKMRELFPQDDVRILICLRRQDDFARSLYQERIKVTRYTSSFDEFIDSERPLFDFYRQVVMYARHFPRVEVVRFQDLVRDGDLNAAFFGLMGVNIDFTDKRPVTNASLPVEYVEFKRLLNKTRISNDESKAVGKRLLKMAGNDALDPDKNLDWASFDRIREFQNSFDADNERLRREFAPHLEGPLFPDPKPNGKKVFEGLTAARAVQFSRRFMSKFG